MKSKPIENWKELLAWIDEEYQRRKKRRYPFDGQSCNLLRKLALWISTPECMALYSVYVRHSEFWGPKTGYLISGLWQERSVLLDHPNFKKMVRECEGVLGYKDCKDIPIVLNLGHKL